MVDSFDKVVFGSDENPGGIARVVENYKRHFDAIELSEANRAKVWHGNAAQFLGINPRSLWHRIKKYRIDVATLKKLQDL